MSWNQAHAPLLVKSFPKTPRTPSEVSRFGGSHNYKTEKNKLLSFIDRWVTSFKNFLVLVSKPTWSPQENLAHGAQHFHRKPEKLYKNTYISPWTYKHQWRLCGQHCFFYLKQTLLVWTKNLGKFWIFGFKFLV